MFEGEENGLPNKGHCQEFITLFVEQEQKHSKEFRQIRRNIAALTQQVSEHGLREIFGGVGYIPGLSGVAKIAMLAHIPVIIVDAGVSAFAASFLLRV